LDKKSQIKITKKLTIMNVGLFKIWIFKWLNELLNIKNDYTMLYEQIIPDLIDRQFGFEPINDNDDEKYSNEFNNDIKDDNNNDTDSDISSSGTNNNKSNMKKSRSFNLSELIRKESSAMNIFKNSNNEEKK